MSKHIPVLLKEVIENLKITESGVYIDCTLGGGGYFEALIENLNKLDKSSLLIGIDEDIDSIKAYIEKTKTDYGVDITENEVEIEYLKVEVFEYKIGKTEIVIVNTNFSKLEKLIALFKETNRLGERKVLGIVADLGFSSDQLTNGRGFSFKNESDELDMRMDLNSNVKAKDLLNALSSKEIANLIYEYADEPRSRIVAEEIVIKRVESKFETVGDLLKALNKVKGISDREDFYQRIFQALRIAVNSELESLKELLSGSLKVIDEGGRVIIVSFHSGEERLVKQFINLNILKSISEDSVSPSVKEILKNPRSRSAKLRGYIK